ncbi:hypothetical protein HDU97_002471 [Phlyctochytrium planicorne]|nr:hypothetical protein HDU97_002471 [Phlyctochytrium planicorne]
MAHVLETLPKEVLEAILIHLRPSGPVTSAHVPSQIAPFEISGVRLLGRISATSKLLKAFVESSDAIWNAHWNAIFDPCYDGAAKLPITFDLSIVVTLVQLPAQVYQKRLKARYQALSSLMSESMILASPSLDYDFHEVADMCQESVSKNAAIIGKALNISLFFKYFETVFEHVTEGPTVCFEAWPLHLDFFQVLAHFLCHGSNIDMIVPFIGHDYDYNEGYNLSYWLHYNAEFEMPSPPAARYIQVCRVLGWIRINEPTFRPPPPLPIPRILSKGSQDWLSRFASGTFAGFKCTPQSLKTTPLIAYLSLKVHESKTDGNYAILDSASGAIATGSTWTKVANFYVDISESRIFFDERGTSYLMAYWANVSEFGLIGSCKLGVYNHFPFLLWKEGDEGLEWPQLERWRPKEVEEAKLVGPMEYLKI